MCTGGGKRGHGNMIPRVVVSGGNEKKLHEGGQHKNGGTEIFYFPPPPPFQESSRSKCYLSFMYGILVRHRVTPGLLLLITYCGE